MHESRVAPEDETIASLVEEIIIVDVQGHVSRDIGIVRQAVINMLRKGNLNITTYIRK
jgi:hypothetical protein